MATTKQRGDSAELRVAHDLVERGHGVAFPFGEDCDFDLILCRDDGRLERVQVKYTRSDGVVITVRCRSSSLTNGKVRAVKRYTAAMIDWLAVYDATTDRCYYVPSRFLGAGRSQMLLRLVPTRNGQRRGVHFAADFLTPDVHPDVMEPVGFEPTTSRMQTGRSSQLSYGPVPPIVGAADPVHRSSPRVGRPVRRSATLRRTGGTR